MPNLIHVKHLVQLTESPTERQWTGSTDGMWDVSIIADSHNVRFILKNCEFKMDVENLLDLSYKRLVKIARKCGISLPSKCQKNLLRERLISE